jgi:hypothetical protein
MKKGDRTADEEGRSLFGEQDDWGSFAVPERSHGG